ncbi:MAG: ABC transporter permease subunit [Desulfuromonadaceae bacterium]|nr:ABC transporter permease subunit [Desulfuromonadaceae bacterium]
MEKKTLRRIKRHDRIAAFGIRGTGVLVIAGVILILLLIGREALPLFSSPTATLEQRVALPDGLTADAVLAVGVDEYLQQAYVVDRQGRFIFFRLADQQVVSRLSAQSGVDDDVLTQVEPVSQYRYALHWRSGRISLQRVRFVQHYNEQGQRVSSVFLDQEASFAPVDALPNRTVVARSDQGSTRVSLLPGQTLDIEQQVTEEDFLGNETTQSYRSVLEQVHPDALTVLKLDHGGRTLYAATRSGGLLRWDLSEPGVPRLLDKVQAFDDHRAITALTLLIGDQSLAVGDETGLISVWFPVPTEEGPGSKRLGLIHALSVHDAPVEQLVPSSRNRTVLSLDDNGVAHLDYSTSERHLLTLVEKEPFTLAALSVRGDALLGLQRDGAVGLWRIDCPHPEAGFKALFGKIWYESYQEPQWVWQSSAASDEFEAKLSLVPLIFGTLKGTFYAMIFAIPLALLGAVYTSQFGSVRLREVVKPAVEIMAAVPSVIIGFLAALWFAPLLERSFPGFVLTLVLVPLLFVLLLLVWSSLRQRPWARYVERGHEFLVLAPLLVLALAMALQLGPWLENGLFGGDFKLWLFQQAGVRYDARNSIVIAFALGFAVIPIIFTMAEDALSNVPGSLKAASLALGASRWQTVWRVVLPSASPGIFAAIMIGLGRAVGETMIVLMATGNTPIMDWSMFNGMRPLSANIAVEIPEAPHGDTLYRVLFLSAVLLFVMTFVLNTVAEIVRQRLRRKYGRF